MDEAGGIRLETIDLLVNRESIEFTVGRLRSLSVWVIFNSGCNLIY